jgi:general secretion pathway protein K
MPRRDNGVILIALLWILTALSVLALSFSRESFVEVAVARNTRDLSDSYYIARAGIMNTILKLQYRRFVPVVRRAELPLPPDPIDLGHLSGAFGDGSYDVDIQDEAGKLNLNFVGEDQIRLLLESIAIPKPESDIITDSILDWRDVDAMRRMNGAEDDYYQTLNPPYKAKNGRFETTEELLLVRGVTRDYYYGHPDKAPDGSIIYTYGLSRYFTVYSNSNRINVNYAPLPVLLSAPGMTPQAAQAIFQRRQTKPFENVTEITQQLGINLGNAMAFLGTDATGVYTLTATGHKANSNVRRTIRAVVVISDQEWSRYKIVYWNENVPNL